MKVRTLHTALLFSILALLLSFCIVLPVVTSAMLQPTVINVAAGGDVQAAINQARDLINSNAATSVEIVLEANADYTCDCELPEKLAAFISIQSSAVDQIVGRAGPSQAHLLARVRSTHSAISTFKTRARARGYKLRGLDITPHPAGQSFSIVAFGSSGAEQDTLEEQPHDLFIEKSWVHPDIDQECQRGLSLNSGTAHVIDSTIEGHGAGYDSQAIVGWNGTGPFFITNSLLIGPGETIMFGGADPSIQGLITSDVILERSHVFIPQSWNPFNREEFRPLSGQQVVWTTTPSAEESRPRYVDAVTGHIAKHWTVKNRIESKNVRRWLINGCIIENNWADGQAGAIIVLKSANQDGSCSWCNSSDITISNSIIKNADSGLSILGHEPFGTAVSTNKLRIVNNLWLNIRGRFIEGLNDADDVVFDHNTQIVNNERDVSHAMSLYGRTSTGYVVTNNITLHGVWGIRGDAVGEGTVALDTYTPGWIYRRNVLAGARVDWDGTTTHDWPRLYPTDNFYPLSYAEVRFVDAAAQNYRLAADSPYKNAATDGKDIGCDIDALEAAMSGSSPTPTPTPSPTATPSPTPTATPTPQPTPTPSPTPTPARACRFNEPVSSGCVCSGVVHRNGRCRF